MFKKYSLLIKMANLLLALSTVLISDPKSWWAIGEPKLPKNLIESSRGK